MASPILETQIERFAINLRKKFDFPSYVSGAEYSYLRKTAKSGDIKKNEFVKTLEKELTRFGTLGSKFEGSSIGFCAETVSANKVLERYPTHLHSLHLGKAIRPRTMQSGKKCKICKSIF